MRGASVPVGQASLKVLIVEDEAIVALELELAVQAAGHLVAGVAADLNEAISIARAQRLDLALVDINLRDGRTGVRLAELLAQDHQVAVMFLTANPDLVPPGFADALGVYPKPYDVDAVGELIRFAANIRLSDLAGPIPRRFQAADWLKDRLGGLGPLAQTC